MLFTNMYHCAKCGAFHTPNELETVRIREPHGEVYNMIICPSCGSDEIAEIPSDYRTIWSSPLELAMTLYEGGGYDIIDFEDGEEILEDYEEKMGLCDEEDKDDIDLTERDDFFKDIANKVELIGAQ